MRTLAPIFSMKRLTIYFLGLWTILSCQSKTGLHNKSNIGGHWLLDSATSFPVEIPSFCDRLDRGTEIYFGPGGKVEVHPVDTTGNKGCDSYTYAVYGPGDSQLNLIEYDMVMVYQINKLDSNVLVVTSQFKPTTIKLTRKNRR
jgi:hypothetical protein